MKKPFVLLILICLGAAARAALPQPDLIAQIHFAGAQKISASPNANAFTNEFCSAEAQALRKQTADKLSGWLSGWLQSNLPATVADGGAKLRPLLDDLQTAEWFLEARATPSGKPAMALAIKLDSARAQLWQDNLKPFFGTATFKTGGGWLIFDSNPALLKLADRLAQKISAPTADWLDLDLNWVRLAGWYPELKELGLPETQFSVTAPDANFRITGKFLFPEKLALALEAWRVPTNALHQPFNSFTAVRGFATWLQTQPWAQPYQLTPVPNQLFAWSLPSFPFQTFAAFPVPDGADAMTQAYARLTPVFAAANARDAFVSAVTPEMTNNEITFTGLPFISPHLRALHEPAGQFLFFEPFPNSPKSKPLPPELFSRLALENLVFYHWEITAERMSSILNLSQFGLMITSHKQLEDNTAAFKWLQRTGPTLGNTDTEITQSGPAELAFKRKTPGLFTATELITLANWLEATNFPGCDLKLPPPSSKLKRLHQHRQQNTPPATLPGH